ncbi:hypothetical protein GCM10022239_10710 [Leifsonia bigeumensis]|uniref:DUF3105 domain-containing protein n=1 Tax=Leifsonella bigeumensis TaxID=433643 RepID=A0ABP7FGH7_9MICO
MASSTNPPKKSAAPGGKLTVKQEREQRRQAKVEAFKKEQARSRRNRLFGIWGAVVGSIVAVGLVVTIVVITATPKKDPLSIELTGLKTWDVPGAVHVDPERVDYKADYGMDPPAGGPHWSAWLNCGIYDEPQENERAVHALEHGAVWVTYNPDEVTGAALDTLRDRMPRTYSILSPYPGLDSPVVASAWGAQIRMDGVDDERLDGFIARYWQSGTAPELGASCTGAVDGPGKIG